MTNIGNSFQATPKSIPIWNTMSFIFGSLLIAVFLSLLVLSCVSEIYWQTSSWIIVYSIFSLVFILWARKCISGIHEMHLFFFYIFYLFTIYTAKLIYAFFFPELFWNTSRGAELILHASLGNLNYSYYIFLFGYIPLTAGYLLFSKSKGSNYITDKTNEEALYIDSITNVRLKTYLIIFLCLVGLIVKYISIHYLQIGLPGVRQSQILIPGLNGVLYFFSTPCLLFLLTILLMVTATSRQVFLFGLSLILFAAFAVIDLSVGWKTPLLSHPLILGFVAYACHRRGLQKYSRSLFIGTLILGLVGMSSFIGLQQYRNARLAKRASEHQLVDIVSSSKTTLKKGFVSIYSRVGGLDQLMTTTNYLRTHPGFKPLGITSFWGNSLTKFYTYKMTDVPQEAVSENSSNQWGQFMISLGFYGMMVGMFILGVALYKIQKIFINRGSHPLLKDAIVPSLCLLYFKIITSTGEFIYLSKYILMLWITYYMVKRILGVIPRGTSENTVCS